MDVLKRRLVASTLVETLVAMIIVVICITIASMIYTNLLTSSNSKVKLSAMLLLQDVSLKTQQEKTFIDEEIRVNNITIIKNITKYPNTDNLYTLSLQAKDEQKRSLASRRELIIILK